MTIVLNMSTLADIETAADMLSTRDKAALLLFLSERLRADPASLPEPRAFTPEELSGWINEDNLDMKRLNEAK